jgi:dethiobiotin synthetase
LWFCYCPSVSATRIIFITGTDTGVGKTVLTALLLRHLRAGGCRALAMKPFCSGGRGDVRLLQSLQCGELSDAEMNPFYFGAPVAPLVELKKARRDVPLKEVVASIRRVEKKCDLLLIEGSGGLMVPLGKNYLVEDLIVKLKCSVIVVARNRLGTINHTLLTVARLRAKRVKNCEIRVALVDFPPKDASFRSNEGILRALLCGIEVVSVAKLPEGKGFFRAKKEVVGGIKRALERLVSDMSYSF